MNNKNLAWSITVLSLVATVFLAVGIYEKLNQPVTGNTISFSGEGKIFAKPDIAKINFAIITEGATSKDAQNKNSPKSQTVVDFLKSQGMEDKDIKTTSYNISPQYNYPRSSTPEIKGYQVSQSFEVKVRDLDKVSVVLDGLVSAGANNIINLGFFTDDPEILKAEARAKAISDAKKKANELEKQLSIRLGKIVNFSENAGGFSNGVFYAKAAEAGVGGGRPSLPTGENEITINVTLTYQIK
ncbi:MAG: SIMPL domain-containing protein [Candidatus Yanofskybacteria bacterium]|nr:SIMPL domain-containing protein [Candidatus Yanofskybacteria bacterium]